MFKFVSQHYVTDNYSYCADAVESALSVPFEQIMGGQESATHISAVPKS